MLEPQPSVFNQVKVVDRSRRSQGDDFGLTLAGLARALRHQAPTFLIVASLVIAVAAIYLVTTPTAYTAETVIMLERGKLKLLGQQQVVTEQGIEVSDIESEIELIRSDKLVQSVIRELGLTTEFDWDPEPNPLLRTLRSLKDFLVWSTGDEPESEDEFMNAATAIFQDNLRVRRIGLTYVIEVAFTSRDGEKAARIANAVARAYMKDHTQTKVATLRRAGAWLQERMSELQTQAITAERAVEEFKIRNNLVVLGTGGRLLNEQQISEISSQLLTARAQTAEARARFERLQQITIDSATSTAMPDVLKNEVLIRLRQRYIDVRKREAEWQAQFGRDNASFQVEKAGLEASIADELHRTAESYRSEYEITKAREGAIEVSLNEAIRLYAQTNDGRVKLRDLESSAQAYRTLYENFLRSYNEATQQQNSPISEARVIKVATAPLVKSSPRTSFILGLALIAALVSATAAAAFREHFDNVFRSSRQLEVIAGITSLGLVPVVSGKECVAASGVPGSIAQRVSGISSLIRYVVRAPSSRFAEAIAAVKLASDIADYTGRCKVIGVVSARDHEGRTTVAANLGQLIALSGSKALLIDADLQSRSMSKALVPAATTGLFEALELRVPIDEAVYRDPQTGLDLLPAIGDPPLYTGSVLVSKEMRTLLDVAQSRYDYIVIDLPPIESVVTAQTASQLSDGLVMVVEWGRTTRDDVLLALDRIPEIRDKLLGGLLNKVNFATVKRYGVS